MRLTDFWPSNLDLTDTASPIDILREAKAGWSERSDGLFDLEIQEDKLGDSDRMLTVHARHTPSDRTAALFVLYHRSSAPYPVRIQPNDDDIPEMYKKSYYKHGLSDVFLLNPARGREVVNRWVCDTPSELRTKLQEAFNLGYVKTELVSLAAGKAIVDERMDKGEIAEDNDDRLDEES